MKIVGGNVFTQNHEFEKRDLLIEDEKIACIYPEGDNADNMEEIIDARDCYVIPGLVDIHMHGAMGHDFCDADAAGIKKILDFELKHGITSVCATTMTFNEERLISIIDVIREYSESVDEHAKLLAGINLEGPFISRKKIGAQNPKYISKPDIDLFKRLQQHSNNMIKLLDIAPEEEGAMELIESCRSEVKISLAHNNASYEEAMHAFDKGACHMTHLFNAMPAIDHRQPGPIIAAIERQAEVELIGDGVHIHPAIIRFVFNSFDGDKVILISDSMEATGLNDGCYELGGQAVDKKGNIAVLKEYPETIAGSVSNLFDCMRYVVQEAGIPFEKAIVSATENPAKSIGIFDEFGSITEGKYANLLVVDKNLNIKTIIYKGKEKEISW